MTSAPELVPSVWVDGDEVVIHDRAYSNPGRINVAVVQMAWHKANQSDTGWVLIPESDGGQRTYHRDVLLMARDLVDAIPNCGFCGDRFGVQRIGDDNTPACVSCCSTATCHDDRDED